MQERGFEYIVSAEEMKRYDGNTIGYFGLPSLVLMERAALAVVREIEKRAGTGSRVLIAAGCGNNGGDGIAIGRILGRHGYQVEICFPGNREKCSPEARLQLEIAEKYGCPVKSKIGEGEYDIIVDALFGIGLSRKLEGEFAETVKAINQKKAFVCAVDIASGVNADTGEIMGTAVRADLTVTFAFKKPGHILYPGCEYGGSILCRDIGIGEESFLGQKPKIYTYAGEAGRWMPPRNPGGNKGSFGKVLVVAGSVNMSGACQLCAESVYRAGAGMVKVLTPGPNREIIQGSLPEALLATYSPEEGMGQQELEELMEWADCMVIGPGLGKGAGACQLLEGALAGFRKPLVIDADGINLLAEAPRLQSFLEAERGLGREIILTPHMGEFARLYGCSVEEAKRDILLKPKELAGRYGCTVVCKDARTVVAAWNEESIYLNTSGNDGMATAGSGDVLAGIIGGLLAQKMRAYEAAALGVYLHGRAGDAAAERLGSYALMAGDMVRELGNIAAGAMIQ